MPKAIAGCDEEELAQREADLWATYWTIRPVGRDNVDDIRRILTLISRVQCRRKKLGENSDNIVHSIEDK